MATETYYDQQQEKKPEKPYQETETEAQTATQTAGNQLQVPSASSSPNHEFSFTVSLNSTQQTTQMTQTRPPATTAATTEPAAKQKPAPFAIDLTPADEIFFHGHLLPLHFLSHLHAASSTSPRSSTNSLDSFTLPIREVLPNNPIPGTEDGNDHHSNEGVKIGTTNQITNSKQKGNHSFSLFTKWKKQAPENHPNNNNDKKKLKFDMREFIKRYINMVKPLLSVVPKGSSNKVRVRRQSYSFSAAISTPRDKRLKRGGVRGEFSAPASMRTSPANSGHLSVAGKGIHSPAKTPSPANDSTMEELQAAIQAAIAHCKNSIANNVDEEKQKHKDVSVPVN